MPATTEDLLGEDCSVCGHHEPWLLKGMCVPCHVTHLEKRYRWRTCVITLLFMSVSAAGFIIQSLGSYVFWRWVFDV